MNYVASKRTLAVMGVGAAAGLGTYLYRKPRLRKKMWKTGSLTQGAKVLTNEIRHDSADIAHEMTATMYDGMASGLERTRNVLGLRFLRRGTHKKMAAAKVGARHVKNEAKHLGKTAMNEARHAAGAMKNEVERAKDQATDAKDLAMTQMSK